MSRQPCGSRGRMSRLWTAHVLTLAQVLTLLFVGSCFCRVTEAPSNVTRVLRSNATATTLPGGATTEDPGPRKNGAVKGQRAAATESYTTASRTTLGLSTLLAKGVGLTHTTSKTEVKESASPTYAPRAPARLQERLAAIDCDLPLLPNESRLWRGNETHELNLPITVSL
ncbi:hypothetical protein EVAR_16531_1 [Eumeta japonica]|uniref:Uncharacterized protein n=1 Tax=Eumeta variegata TaxID=151549 RepID=A0A4C1U314_EUMVA|nr:hypothetical protein EVAR_16531_1 [Eumeta japonica]